MKHQKGMSFIQILFFACILIFVGTLGFTLAPPYLEHLTIKKSLQDLAKQPDIKTQSTGKIRDLLLRRFQVNNIKNVKATDLDVDKRDGKIYLSMDYEVRVHVMFNVDAVVKFNEVVLVE